MKATEITLEVHYDDGRVSAERVILAELENGPIPVAEAAMYLGERADNTVAAENAKNAASEPPEGPSEEPA